MTRNTTSWASPVSSKWREAAMLLFVLLGFGLRLYRLDYESLWVDEAISAHLATLSPQQIVLNRADSLHSPVYFLALAVWTNLAGTSEFSLRFFSVWTGLLLVPMIYRACRRLFPDERTSLLAGLMAAISPASVVYAQETRMYAILPVAYLLVLAYALGGEGPQSPREWLLLALSESLCLYLHSFSLFVLLAVNVLLLATRLRGADGHVWQMWIASQLAAGLSYTPWLLAVWRWGRHVPDKLSRSSWRASPVDPLRFVRQLWEFANSGLVGIGQVEAMRHVLILTGLLLVVGLLLAVLLGPRKRLLEIAAALLIPLGGTYAVWYFRPLAHPRYALFLLAPLLIIVARVVSLLTTRHTLWLAGVVLIGLVISSQIAALSFAFFDSRFLRYDARALSAAVAARATRGEAVLMPPGDYSLHYYEPTPADPVNLPGEMGTEGGRLDLRELGSLLQDRPGAFLVTYSGLRSIDERNQVPFLLETNGRLVEQFLVDRMLVNHYQLDPPWVLPQPSLITANCGPLQLTGVYTQSVVEADNAVTVALRWRLSEPTVHDHKAVVRLWDDGQQIAASDVRLLNDLGRPTSLWKTGEEAVNTHVLPLPMGTPPLTYGLKVKVYEGQGMTWHNGEEWLPLGEVQVLQAVGQRSDPYGSWSGADWQQPTTSEIVPGLILEGYTTRPEVLKPGDRLYVSLRWRATANNVADCAPSLVLSQNATALARDAGTLFGRYPTTRWAAGELLIETRELPVPAALEALDLLLEVNGRTAPVGKVAVAKDALMWELPDEARPACAWVGHVGKLVGYEWEMESGPSRSGLVTLYWRASSTAPAETSYTVFVHLVDPEGRLLAQHDDLPRGGRRPTTTWLPGEIIADQHRLQADVRFEDAQLLIGMYDLRTGERVAAYDCEGRRLRDDIIPLTHVARGEASQSGAVSPALVQRSEGQIAGLVVRAAEATAEALPWR